MAGKASMVIVVPRAYVVYQASKDPAAQRDPGAMPASRDLRASMAKRAIEAPVGSHRADLLEILV